MMRARPGEGIAVSTIIIAIAIIAFAATAIAACEVAYYPYFTRGDPGVLWVSNSLDNTVTCIDRVDDKIIGTYPVGKNPSRTAVDLSGNCWVGSRDEGTVYFVTPYGTTKRFDTSPNPRGIALDRQGNLWVASSGRPEIQKIDVKTGTVSAPVSFDSGYFYGALVDSEGYYWILDQSGQRMLKYDTSKFPDPSAVTSIPIQNQIYGFTIDQDGTVWIAGYLTSFLYKIPKGSTSSPQPIDLSPYSGIHAVTFDILGKIWITNDGAHQVLRYDPATGACDPFPVNGTNPHGLGSDEGGYIYAVNQGSNNVSKIDCRTGAVVTQYSVGRVPYIYSDLTGFVYRTVTRK